MGHEYEDVTNFTASLDKIKRDLSQFQPNEILDIINQIEGDDFILANAARLVYLAGLHKIEIINLKIEHVTKFQGEIQPSVDLNRNLYSKNPIKLSIGNRYEAIFRVRPCIVPFTSRSPFVPCLLPCFSS